MIAHQSFRFLDMLLTEEELTVEVAEVDSVQINNVDLTEASEDKILQKLAANSSGADHQNARLTNATISRDCKRIGTKQTCWILGYR